MRAARTSPKSRRPSSTFWYSAQTSKSELYMILPAKLLRLLISPTREKHGERHRRNSTLHQRGVGEDVRRSLANAHTKGDEEPLFLGVCSALCASNRTTTWACTSSLWRHCRRSDCCFCTFGLYCESPTGFGQGSFIVLPEAASATPTLLTSRARRFYHTFSFPLNPCGGSRTPCARQSPHRTYCAAPAGSSGICARSSPHPQWLEAK